ncbi:hypothetical protein MY4824_008616 [Beauveria thailandica]
MRCGPLISLNLLVANNHRQLGTNRRDGLLLKGKTPRATE